MQHKDLLDLGKTLNGLPPDLMGMCRGFAMRWIEAYLAYDEEVFLQRIDYLEQNNITLENVNAVREKVKAHKPLTQPDNELLDIIAFYTHST